jgi:hypothetical protein
LLKTQVPLDLEGGRRFWNFYCPLCAVTRRLRTSPEPGKAIHFLRVGVCAWVFTLLFFPVFGWKGLVSFLPFWIVFETVYRLRLRVELRCPECGFDPILCLSDIKRAKEEVASHWRRKLESSSSEKESASDSARQQSPPSELSGSNEAN